MAGAARLGKVWLGAARRGLAGGAGLGWARFGLARCGLAGTAKKKGGGLVFGPASFLVPIEPVKM